MAPSFARQIRIQRRRRRFRDGGVPRRTLRLEHLEDRRLLSAFREGIPDWVDRGPGPILQGQVQGLVLSGNPVAGAVNAIAAHPTDANTLFVGTVGGGVWLTHNARWPSDGIDNDGNGAIDTLDTTSDGVPDVVDPGEVPSWATFTDQYPSLAIGAIAFSPLDPVTLAASNQVLFAGSGSSSSTRAGGPNQGILMTRDGGGAWTVLGEDTFAGLAITSVVASPSALPSR